VDCFFFPIHVNLIGNYLISKYCKLNNICNIIARVMKCRSKYLVQLM